jgi:TRAP-type C4-dicarboxylate transport system permease small subunit
MIKRIEKASHSLNKWIVTGVSFLIIIMMIIVVADVSGRYVFNSPIKGATEVSQIILAFVTFMGVAYAFIMGTHARVTLFFRRLPHSIQAIAEILSGTLGLFLFILLTWGGIEQFWESWTIQEIMPAPVKVPFWIAKVVLPIGALLMVIQCIIYILHHFNNLFSKSEKK